MQIFINDKAFECSPGATLAQALDVNNIKTDHVAIAMNLSVIPRAQWGVTVLQEGCKVIIIKAVQGG